MSKGSNFLKSRKAEAVGTVIGGAVGSAIGWSLGASIGIATGGRAFRASRSLAAGGAALGALFGGKVGTEIDRYKARRALARGESQNPDAAPSGGPDSQTAGPAFASPEPSDAYPPRLGL